MKIGQPANYANMWKFSALFSDWFFQEVITGLFKIEIYDEVYALKRDNDPLCGYCNVEWPRYDRDPRYKREKSTALIAIKNSHEDSGNHDPFSKMRSMLETLAHEMLHFIFDLYVCKCTNGCCYKGLAGHGVE